MFSNRYIYRERVILHMVIWYQVFLSNTNVFKWIYSQREGYFENGYMISSIPI